MAKQTENTFTKLGYSHLDTAEIITHLNRVISDQVLLQQKLRGFRWNMAGPEFFSLQSLFQELQHEIMNDADELAGRIRLFGQLPAATYAEYLKLASIREESPELTTFQMVKNLLGDIRVLLESLENAMKSADHIGDNGTRHMLQSIALRLEQYHWKMTAWTQHDARKG